MRIIWPSLVINGIFIGVYARALCYEDHKPTLKICYLLFIIFGIFAIWGLLR